jgi:hypothetical protein
MILKMYWHFFKNAFILWFSTSVFRLITGVNCNALAQLIVGKCNASICESTITLGERVLPQLEVVDAVKIPVVVSATAIKVLN